MTTYEGHCHCGAVQVFFETKIAPEDVAVRACQCGFCRRRGAAYVGDPQGRMEVRAAPGALRRYQFATRTADFLLCRECGQAVGAVMPMGESALGVINVRGADVQPFAGAEAQPIDFGDEAAGDRVDRRHARWTPAVVIEAQPNA